MSHAHEAPRVPRGALLGAALLVGFALIAAGGARVSDLGTTRTPIAAPVSVLELRFTDRADGAVVVEDARWGETLEVIAPGTNGFVRGVLRGMARERKRQNIGVQPPFRLTRWADGRLSLDDPSTGRHVDLEAFGPTNSGAFVRMMMIADNRTRP
jgi:putative photosynthetic complex assembly protein